MEFTVIWFLLLNPLFIWAIFEPSQANPSDQLEHPADTRKAGVLRQCPSGHVAAARFTGALQAGQPFAAQHC